MFRIRKRFTFEAAHQLSGAFSRVCTACIHGHSYIVEVFFTAEELDKNGMVLDFGLIAEWTKALAAQWDHSLMLPIPIATAYQEARDHGELRVPLDKIVICPSNPTAENMAKWTWEGIRGKMMQSLSIEASARRVRVEKVRIHETASGWAEYEPKE
jgi:6-pyruvoyltetrahydropterin/6-carboxytetrahydropterin synthase